MTTSWAAWRRRHAAAAGGPAPAARTPPASRPAATPPGRAARTRAGSCRPDRGPDRAVRTRPDRAVRRADRAVRLGGSCRPGRRRVVPAGCGRIAAARCGGGLAGRGRVPGGPPVAHRPRRSLTGRDVGRCRGDRARRGRAGRPRWTAPGSSAGSAPRRPGPTRRPGGRARPRRRRPAAGHQRDRGHPAVRRGPQLDTGCRGGGRAGRPRTGRAGRCWRGRSRAGRPAGGWPRRSPPAIMPRPRSSISTAYPLGTTCPAICTRVCGGENDVAFSMSSASRWMTSPTARPTTAAGSTAHDVDPRVVLDLGRPRRGARRPSAPGCASRGRAPRRPGSTRSSACRRIRVARWSTRNRSSSSSGSVGAPLHPVEQGQLAVQQRLAAPGDVEEDLVEAAPQRRLVDRGLHGGALHLAERLPDLADLVVAVLQRRRLAADVDLLAAAQPGRRRPAAARRRAPAAAARRPAEPADAATRPTRIESTTATMTAMSPSDAGQRQPHEDADRDRDAAVHELVGGAELEVAQALLRPCRTTAARPGRRPGRPRRCAPWR